MVGKIAVAVVAVIAFFIALNPKSSIMGLVSDAWAGFGSAFGPVVLLALFWKRSTLSGAISGMATGALTVIIWDYIPLVNGQTLYAATNLYSLVVGFGLALIVNVIVSLLSKNRQKKSWTNLIQLKILKYKTQGQSLYHDCLLCLNLIFPENKKNKAWNITKIN